MERGLYVTFASKDEPPGRALPAVGPLDNVVLRRSVLLAERRTVHQAQELGVSIDRWLEAELEMQRATGAEPGGTRRTQLRFAARDGVYLRFTVFGQAHEPDAVPELGPFSAVVVEPRSLEADGVTIATRAAGDAAPWELTSGTGDAVGARKPDLALRTANTAYHPSIGRAASPRTLPEVHSTESASSPQQQAVPPPEFGRERIARLEEQRRDDSLRARFQDDVRKRVGADGPAIEAASDWTTRHRPRAAANVTLWAEAGSGREWGAALWRLRFAVVGVLLLGVAVYSVIVLRAATAPGARQTPQVPSVGIGQRLTGSAWDFVVNGVQRSAVAGTARANGTYYVVRVAATSRGAEGQQLAPGDFTLIDANGTEYRADGLLSGTYRGPANPGSPYLWPQSFPAGRAVTLSVVFDIDPSLPRGMLLRVTDPSNVRVRLD